MQAQGSSCSDDSARSALTEQPTSGGQGGSQLLDREDFSPPPAPALAPRPDPGEGLQQPGSHTASQLLSPLCTPCSSFGQLQGEALTDCSSPSARLEARGSVTARVRQPPCSGGGDGQYGELLPLSNPGDQGDGADLLLQLLVTGRARLGLPLVQPLLRLFNDSRTVCYANGVVNVVLSTPLLVRFFLALSSKHPLVLALQGLCVKDPSTPASLDLLRSSLVDVLPRYHYFRQTGQQQDGQEFLSALIEALQNVVTVEERAQLRWLLLVGTDQLLRCTSKGHIYHQPRHCSPGTEVLTLPVLHPDTRKPLYTLGACLDHCYSGELVDRRCHVGGCSSEKSVQLRRISKVVTPQVSHAACTILCKILCFINAGE